MGTRTGNFPLGFRRGGGAWQKDLAALSAWAKETGFDVLDLPRCSPEDIAVLKGAGLGIGTADLPEWPALLSLDAGKRKAAVAQNSAYIRTLAQAGVRRFFCVAIPEDKDGERQANHKLAVESYGALGEVAEAAGAMIVFEGWPGGGNLPNLACTPESCRALFRDSGGKGLGINYDPSHLIRMGIDHVRFAREFAPKIGHVHAKDTETFAEAVYEYGLYQPAIFQPGHRWGQHVWRYAIPGHGVTCWTSVFRILEDAKFDGAVCVELEDENFNGSEEGEKTALEVSLAFLRST